jgi:putative type II/III system pilus formation protein
MDMAAKLGAQCAYVVVLASFLAVAIPTVAFAEIVIKNAPTSTLPSPVAPETCCIIDGSVELRLGFASTFTIKKSFKTIAVGNPKVVKVAPFGQGDHTVLITPVTIGETNVLFFDQENLPMLNVYIVVEDSDITPRMYVYDTRSLAHYFIYRCDNHRCEPREGGALAGNLPLPRGYLQVDRTDTNINHNINETPTAP